MSRESDGTYDANRAQPRTDPTYGQVGAFPGLDTYQFAPFYGPANDGIDYLRMVRSEARDIPHIVTSASRKKLQSNDDYDDEEEDEDKAYARAMREADEQAWAEDNDDEDNNDDADGYYSDGAYVAKPLPASTTHLNGPEVDPQEAYYERLKVLFSKHRTRCHASPSVDAVATLDDQHPISLPGHSKLATDEWRHLLLKTTPLPAQLCSMDKWTIWRLLRLCERHIRRFAIRYENIPSTLAQWIWGLLGRLPESWQMVNEEISKIRELGKCATWCLAQYRFNQSKERERNDRGIDGDADEWDYDEEDADHERAEPNKAIGNTREDGNMDGEEAVTFTKDQNGNVIAEQDATVQNEETPQEILAENTTNGQAQDLSDLFAAKKQELQEVDEQVRESSPTEDEQVPDSQTAAVLDLIITVTGEFYGQRDILWSRPEWHHRSD